MIVNLTPHPITLRDEKGEDITIQSSGSLRVSEITERVTTYNNIPIVYKRFADLSDESVELLERFLKEEKVKIVIVSLPTAQVIQRMIEEGKINTYNTLICFPASYLRNEDGHVVAVRALAVVNKNDVEVIE